MTFDGVEEEEESEDDVDGQLTPNNMSPTGSGLTSPEGSPSHNIHHNDNDGGHHQGGYM